MKTFLITFSMIFVTTASANYMSLSDIAAVKNNQPVRSYVQEHVCELQESQDCLDISNKNPLFHTVGQQQVDDLSRPIWEARSNISSCGSPAACRQLTATPGFCLVTHQAFWGPRQPSGFEAWCTRLLGYEQMTINVLVFDQALKDVYDAAQAAKATREARLATAKAQLVECADDLQSTNNPNMQVVRRCLRLAVQAIIFAQLSDSQTTGEP